MCLFPVFLQAAPGKSVRIHETQKYKKWNSDQPGHRRAGAFRQGHALLYRREWKTADSEKSNSRNLTPS